MSHKETNVFVAEDDVQANSDIVTVLAHAGYAVVGTALNLEDGLQQISTLEHIDAAVLDGDIPTDNEGEELAKAILEKFPEAIIIYVGVEKGRVWSTIPEEQFIGLRKSFIDGLPEVLDDPSIDIEQLQQNIMDDYLNSL